MFMHRLSRRMLGVVSLIFVLVGGAASVGNAQTVPGVVPPASTITSKDIRVDLGFPANAVPTNVSGFRVDFFCTSSPATFDGTWTAIIQYPSTGTSATIATPFTATTQCTVRLIVQGTGNRPLVLSSNSVDSTNVTFRYLETVGGVAVDPQTVIEIGPILVKDFATLRFGVAAPAPTTTTTIPPTTTTIPTTTVPPTTTTTTLPPTTTTASRPPTTAALAPRPPVTTTVRRPVRYVRICVKRVKGKCTATRVVRR